MTFGSNSKNTSYQHQGELTPEEVGLPPESRHHNTRCLLDRCRRGLV